MLTVSQRKTLDYIKVFIGENDYAPTIAEIAQGIGIKSRGVVHRYVKALEEAGEVHITPKRHRNIELIQPAVPGLGSIPLVGCIAAGQPIEAVPQQASIDVASIFTGQGRYALKVKGDSMVDEGIYDGDIVICQSSQTARDGEIVVALIDNEDATLKKLKRNRDNTITLMPANSTMSPMVYPADRVTVQGIFVGLVRMVN